MEKQIENKNNEEAGANSSIELKRTTKGINIAVKVYTADTDEDVDRITKKAQSVFEELQKIYKNEVNHA